MSTFPEEEPKCTCPEPFTHGLGSPPSNSTGASDRSRGQPVLLSVLQPDRCRRHRGEIADCWGTLYRPGDDVTFFVETDDVLNTVVVLDFYQRYPTTTGQLSSCEFEIFCYLPGLIGFVYLQTYQIHHPTNCYKYITIIGGSHSFCSRATHLPRLLSIRSI